MFAANPYSPAEPYSFIRFQGIRLKDIDIIDPVYYGVLVQTTQGQRIEDTEFDGIHSVMDPSGDWGLHCWWFVPEYGACTMAAPFSVEAPWTVSDAAEVAQSVLCSGLPGFSTRSDFTRIRQGFRELGPWTGVHEGWVT